jgi:Zn-dependent protease
MNGSTILLRLPEVVAQLLAFALALSVHESAHGWVAERLGDPTARWLGRITLNPIKHVDLIGTILFPLFLAFVGAPIIGWAKPVPYVPRNLRDQKWGPGLVALAGPTSNFILGGAAIVVLLVLEYTVPGFYPVLRAVTRHGVMGAQGIVAPLAYMLFALALINVVLAVFNLIPIPPLDGSHVLSWVLPPATRYQYAQVGRYGMILLFALLWFGALGYLLRPFLIALVWILRL